MAKDATLLIRLSEEEKAHWHHASEEQGKSLSKIIRTAMNEMFQFTMPEKAAHRPAKATKRAEVTAEPSRQPESIVSDSRPVKKQVGLFERLGLGGGGVYRKGELCFDCQRRGISCPRCKAKFQGMELVK